MDVDARQDVGESAEEDGGGDLPLLDDRLHRRAPWPARTCPCWTWTTRWTTAACAPPPRPGAGFGFGEPAAGAFDDVGYVAHEQDGHDAEAEMVTETMAELYASQGLHAQAADVYRELIGQRGEEPGLVRRLAEIEEQTQVAESAAGYASTGPHPSFELDADGGHAGLAGVGGCVRPRRHGARAGRRRARADLSPAQTDETFAATDASAERHAPGTTTCRTSGRAPGLRFRRRGRVRSLPARFDDGFPSLPPGPGGRTSPLWRTRFESVADFAQADAAPETAGASASADPFADSFADGFDGAVEPAFAASAAASASTGDGRQPWEAPSVAETEPVGFDILVVEDEDGAEIPAPRRRRRGHERRLGHGRRAAGRRRGRRRRGRNRRRRAGPRGAPGRARPRRSGLHGAGLRRTGGRRRTMAGYFDSLLAWQPVPGRHAGVRAVGQGGAITIEAAQTPGAPVDVPYEAPSPAAPPVEAPAPDDEPRPYETPGSEPLPYESPEPDPLPYEAPEAASFDAPAFPAAPAIPTFDAPSFQPPRPCAGAGRAGGRRALGRRRAVPRDGRRAVGRRGAEPGRPARGVRRRTPAVHAGRPAPAGPG